MATSTSGLSRITAELRRRHVFRVAVGYGAVGFATVSVASDFLPALQLPDWTVTLVAALAVLGFPVALVLAWAFEITPDGVRRAQPMEPGAVGRAGGPRPATASGYVGLGIIIGLVVIGAYVQLDGRDGPPAGDRVTRVAVLPFQNMTEDPSNEFLSDGITEEITTQLFKVAGLHVKSRTSTQMYKGGRKSVEEVAAELGVGAVVEGSFRRHGSVVRVAARLIDARDGSQMWAETYEREMQDLVRVQVDIAQQITAALRTTLTPDEKRRFAEERKRVVDPDAYEQYLIGVYESGEGRLARGIEAYERAIERDPSFPAPHAGIARNYYFIGFFGGLPPSEAFGRMRDASVKALELDPEFADAHATLALYHLHYKWDWVRADSHFRRALDLAPNAAQVRHDYAHFLLAIGHTDQSAEQSAIASDLDPANTMLKACAGWHGFTDREYDGAVRNSMAALMMMPDMFWPELILGWAYEQKGEHREAIASLRNAVTHSGGIPFAVASLAHAFGRSGQEAQARQLLADLLEKADRRYVSAYDVAIVHAGLGDAASTFDWLRRAYAERSAFLVNIGWEPRFDHLRDDPRFTAIVRNMALPERPAPRLNEAPAPPVPVRAVM
jgi:TolB-like protein/Tfp pilus assembly protein PilF